MRAVCKQIEARITRKAYASQILTKQNVQRAQHFAATPANFVDENDGHIRQAAIEIAHLLFEFLAAFAVDRNAMRVLRLIDGAKREIDLSGVAIHNHAVRERIGGFFARERLLLKCERFAKLWTTKLRANSDN